MGRVTRAIDRSSVPMMLRDLMKWRGGITVEQLAIDVFDKPKQTVYRWLEDEGAEKIADTNFALVKSKYLEEREKHLGAGVSEEDQRDEVERLLPYVGGPDLLNIWKRVREAAAVSLAIDHPTVVQDAIGEPPPVAGTITPAPLKKSAKKAPKNRKSKPIVGQQGEGDE